VHDSGIRNLGYGFVFWIGPWIMWTQLHFLHSSRLIPISYSFHSNINALNTVHPFPLWTCQ
jgi:hypothetical protein